MSNSSSTDRFYNPSISPEKSNGRGCLFWFGLLFLVFIGGCSLVLYLGYRYAIDLVEQYASTSPVALPRHQLSQIEVDRTVAKFNNFLTALEEKKSAKPLSLNTDQLNALISSYSNGHPPLAVTLSGDKVKATVSLPLAELGFSGYYINGEGTIKPEIDYGHLSVYIIDLNVHGKTLPEDLLPQLRELNIAEELNQDPKARARLEKIDRLEVRDSILYIVPKESL